MLRDMIHAVVWFLFRTLSRLRLEGMENIPPTGGYLLCSNHLGLFDAPLVFAALKRRDATALVAKKHHRNLFLRWLVNAVNGIWINREEADTQAIRKMREHMQKGGILGMSPEGTRSKTGALIPAKTGAAYMADKAGVPIIPVAITGTYQDLPRLLRLNRLEITMRAGKPFNLPPVDRRNREACLQANTDEIMCRIAVLLPPEYRGVYSNHPRLLALLAGEELRRGGRG
jgi:1-acyl-sn-glycerol-3-phosphate acyltransferase